MYILEAYFTKSLWGLLHVWSNRNYNLLHHMIKCSIVYHMFRYSNASQKILSIIYSYTFMCQFVWNMQCKVRVSWQAECYICHVLLPSVVWFIQSNYKQQCLFVFICKLSWFFYRNANFNLWDTSWLTAFIPYQENYNFSSMAQFLDIFQRTNSSVSWWINCSLDFC